MILRSLNATASNAHRQRLWIPLLIAFVAICGFLLPLARPERAETHPAPATVAVAPSSPTADLEIIQTGPQTTVAGDQITYTIVVQNKSASTISDVTLFDTWTTKMPNLNTYWPHGVLAIYDDYQVSPPGAVVSFTQQVNDAFRRGEATWWLNPIMAGGSIEIVFTVTVPITLQPALDNYIAAPLPSNLRQLGPSSVENSIFATIGTEPPIPGNLATAQVVAPLLLLTQSAVGEYAALNQARVGRLLTYTINIENVSTRADSWPATNLVITERLPIEVRAGLITATASEPDVTWTYSQATGMLVWQFVPTFVLTRGEQVNVYYTVRVPPDLAYNPPNKVITVFGVPTGDLRAQADLMPFREASLRSNHLVLLLSPFNKTVATLSPPVAANRTFANRPITYTLTYYSPISTSAAMTLEDKLHNTFIFSHTAGGGLPEPEVDGSQLLWKDVVVPGYGVISTTFVITVSKDTLVRAGGNTCTYLNYFNAVTATSELFPVGVYIGHNNNRLAEVLVDPQLRVTKSVAPSSQLPGQNVTYKITVQNAGDTVIPMPIVVTDTLPTNFVYVRMASDPPPGDPVVNGNVLVWSDIPTLTAGASLIFSFEAQVDGATNTNYRNTVEADSPEVPLCKIESAGVTILSPFTIEKTAQDFEEEMIVFGTSVFPLVRQGDSITYTPSIFNMAPRTVYTITQFKDVLDNTGTRPRDRTGLINPITQGLEYTYTLPVPYPLYPETSWEHVFTATMQGFGTGHEWCDDKEQVNNMKVEQSTGVVQFIMGDGSNVPSTKALAPVYVLPHVSLFQQVYPNPVAIGEIVTVVVTLRDNRTNPITPATGINLLWTLPAGFELLDTDPITSSSNATSASWTNVELPLGGEQVFLIHARAPYRKQDGWKASYNATAQVVSLDDMSICIPKATRFVKSRNGLVGPDHALGLPGPIPDWNDQAVVSLEVNQGLEMDKISKPVEIGPYGMVEYTLIIKNLTGAPVSSIVITDILPFYEGSSWDYLETVDGIEPHEEDPLQWYIGAIDALGQTRIVIKTRAASWVGLALNQMLGSAPINIGFNTNYTNNMDVMVVSGIGFYKVVEPKSILAGDVTTYTIRFYNGALYDIQPVVITDTLPLGFSFDAMVSPPTLQPVVNGQQVVWTIPTKIAKSGGTYDIVFRARTATEEEGMFTGKYYNSIIATAKRADTADPVEVPPTGPTAPVQVDGLSTVEIHKTATPNTVIPGQEVVYEITLHNEATTARMLQITDTLPTNFTLVELIDPPEATTTYIGSQQQIVWHNIPISGQSGVTLTFRVQVADEAPPGRYGNVVQLQIDAFALPPTVPMANVYVVELPRTDAKVTKTDGSLVAEKGEIVNYTIGYTNASAEIAFQTIILTETISPPPPYITVLSAGWEDLDNGQFRHIIEGPFNPGASGTVPFSIQLANSIPADYQWLHNQVEIGYTTDEPTIESTPADNVAEDVNLISTGESIVAIKQASHADELLLAGQELTYTITLFNATMQAESARITDTLPASFTLSAAVSPPVEMTQIVDDRQQVVWDGVAIPAQGFADIVFRARVDPAAAGGSACNIVQVQRGNGEVLPETEPQACVVVQPLLRVDAYVDKTDNLDWAKPGDILYYSIQYGNAASSQTTLTSIVLTETVSPPEVIGAMLSGWQSTGNGQYRITLPGLAPGQTGEQLFAIRLSSSIPPTMTAVYNQVEIGYTTDEPAVEINHFDNVAIDVTVLQLDPDDVMVSKSVDAPNKPAFPNDVVTYTINIFNDTMTAYTLRVTDTLPVYFTFEAPVYPTTGYTTQWDGNRQLVIWEATAAPKATLPLIFRAEIASSAPTSRYCNDVQVQRGTVVQAPVTGLACLDVLSSIKVVDAQVSKSNGRTSALPGEVLTYTISYANAATSALPFETIVLTETISPIDYLTVLNSDEWTHLGGGRYIREIPGPLTPGAVREAQFIVELSASLPDTVTRITNTVEIGYTTLEPSTELNLANNTYTHITSVGETIIIVPSAKIYLPLVLRNH